MKFLTMSVMYSYNLATFTPPSSSASSSSEPRRTSSWESGKSRSRDRELQQIWTRASRPTSDSISKLLPSEKHEPLAAEQNEAEAPDTLERDWVSMSGS